MSSHARPTGNVSPAEPARHISLVPCGESVLSCWSKTTRHYNVPAATLTRIANVNGSRRVARLTGKRKRRRGAESARRPALHTATLPTFRGPSIPGLQFVSRTFALAPRPPPWVYLARRSARYACSGVETEQPSCCVQRTWRGSDVPYGRGQAPWARDLGELLLCGLASSEPRVWYPAALTTIAAGGRRVASGRRQHDKVCPAVVGQCTPLEITHKAHTLQHTRVGEEAEVRRLNRCSVQSP